MTGEEMEVSYCKARRTCMKSFNMWLKEHAATARQALALNLSPEQVLNLTISAMEQASAMIDEELSKGVEMISEQEK